MLIRFQCELLGKVAANLHGGLWVLRIVPRIPKGEVACSLRSAFRVLFGSSGGSGRLHATKDGDF